MSDLSGLDADADAERDSRSEAEWHSAVLGYLQFRAGVTWRRGRPQRTRLSARYWEYTDAERFYRDVMYKEPWPCNCRYCLPVYGFRSPKPIPALPILYPGDKFFRLHPYLEPRYDECGRYQGVKANDAFFAQHPDLELRCDHDGNILGLQQKTHASTAKAPRITTRRKAALTEHAGPLHRACPKEHQLKEKETA